MQSTSSSVLLSYRTNFFSPAKTPYTLKLIVCHNKDTIFQLFLKWTSIANQFFIRWTSGDWDHWLRKIYIWYPFTYKERIPLNDRKTVLSSTDTLLPESTLKNLKRQKLLKKWRKVLNKAVLKHCVTNWLSVQ